MNRNYHFKCPSLGGISMVMDNRLITNTFFLAFYLLLGKFLYTKYDLFSFEISKKSDCDFDILRQNNFSNLNVWAIRT